MATETVSLEGLSGTVNALESLKRSVQKKVVRHATRAGAKVVLAAAKSEAPKLSGQTQANIKIRAGGTKQGAYRLNVGVGAKDFQGDQFYAAFVLFGHKFGSRKLGDARKSIAANDWLGRALDESQNAAVDALSDDLIAGVEAAVEAAASHGR